MEGLHWVQVLTPVLTAILLPGIYWIRQLIGTIDGLSSRIGRLEEANHREHQDVSNSVCELKDNLTQEVRDINKAHSLHDQAMAVQGRVLEEILTQTRR